MNNMLIRVCTVAIVLLACRPAVSGEDDWALKTPDDVGKAVVELLPEVLDSPEKIASNAVLFTETNSHIPFAREQLNGKKFWKAKVALSLNLARWIKTDSTDNGTRSFTLVLDPVTAALVSAECVLADDYAGRKAPSSVEVMEEKLSYLKEKIHNFATESPVVSLTEALSQAIGNPYGAREIYIWHVDYARYNFSAEEFEEPHPVWWIDLRGVPPIDPKEPPITNMRTVIDSQSGVHIRSTNMGL